MARYKIFQNGVLINTIEANLAFVMAYSESEGLTYELEEFPQAEPYPSPQEDADALLVDHEYRLTMLELGVTE